MATFFAKPYDGYSSLPATLPSPNQGYGAKIYLYLATITLASQAATDITKLFKLPKGTLPLFGFLLTSATLGSTTIQIGKTGATAKYRADATFTSANTPTLFGVATANVANGVATPLSSDEEVILTWGTATAPSSGTLLVGMLVAGV